MSSDLDHEFSQNSALREYYSDLGPKGAQKEPKGAQNTPRTARGLAPRAAPPRGASRRQHKDVQGRPRRPTLGAWRPPGGAQSPPGEARWPPKSDPGRPQKCPKALCKPIRRGKENLKNLWFFTARRGVSELAVFNRKPPLC